MLLPVDQAATYKGCPLLGTPRTDPDEPNSGTRLLPRVSDGEAHTWPGMKDPWLGEKIIGQLRHPRPHQARLLTAGGSCPDAATARTPAAVRASHPGNAGHRPRTRSRLRCHRHS